MELQISITDLCNYSCIMCMQQAHKGLYGALERKVTRLHGNNRGFIEKETFRKILEKTKHIDFDILKMQWNGESFIHPQIDSILDILGEYSNFRRIVFTTNCSVINEKIIKKLETLNGKIQFVLSIDSFEKSTYRKIKGTDNIAEIIKNIDSLRNNLKNAVYTFQSILMDENFHEIGDFIEHVRKRYGVKDVLWDECRIYDYPADNILIKKLGAYDQKKYDILHREKFLELFPDKDYKITSWDGNGKRKPCPGPFRTPVFNWDGRMTYCCMDSELELSPGNIRDHDFESLWFSDKSLELRKAHIDGDISEHSRCMRCLNLNVENVTQEEMNCGLPHRYIYSEVSIKEGL